ncbi:hypothetical protein R1sor_026319 [Riccia sorocarpa]|uniref:Uncharacterized protein n=1 Tax=Riccia sorocarpa TaxID=122646 RepID=A0ABD3GCI2_9MARC
MFYKFFPYINVLQVLEFQTKVEAETAFVNFYPPMDKDYKPPPGEKPPLLLPSHEFVSGLRDPALEAKTRFSYNSAKIRFSYKYWTSRGWAIADVDCYGSFCVLYLDCLINIFK